MRFAVLSFPRLPIQLARRANPALCGKPVGLVRGEGDGSLLAAVSVEATADGVEPGMTALQARQRCPGIELLPDAPARSLDALDAVISIIRTRATTNVAILSRNEIALSLEGLEARFADEGAAALAIAAMARSWSALDARVAVASTIAEAACAARKARRFPVIVPPSTDSVDSLPVYEPVAAAFTWPAPASAAEVDARTVKLAGSLEAAMDAYRQSYREIVVELTYGPYRRALRVQPEQPVHTAAEALAAIRRRLPATELDGVSAIRIMLGRPGPALNVDPWRSPVATIHQLVGPAVPVQRRLLRAS